MVTMENEQLQGPPLPLGGGSTAAATTTSSITTSSSSGRQAGPQISVYSGIPDRQTVQVSWEKRLRCVCCILRSRSRIAKVRLVFLLPPRRLFLLCRSLYGVHEVGHNPGRVGLVFTLALAKERWLIAPTSQAQIFPARGVNLCRWVVGPASGGLSR